MNSRKEQIIHGTFIFLSTCHLIQFHGVCVCRLCCCCCFFHSSQIIMQYDSMFLFFAHLFYVIIVCFVGSVCLYGMYLYEYFLMIKGFSRLPDSSAGDNGAKMGMIIEQPWSKLWRICIEFCLLSLKRTNLTGVKSGQKLLGTILYMGFFRFCAFFSMIFSRW